MNTGLSLPSIRLLAPAALTTPPHFMPEYINNLSLLPSLFFIFALHRTQSLNLFTAFFFPPLLIFLPPFHIRCCFCFPHSWIFSMCSLLTVKKSHAHAVFPPLLLWFYCHFRSFLATTPFFFSKPLMRRTAEHTHFHFIFSEWIILRPEDFLSQG